MEECIDLFVLPAHNKLHKLGTKIGKGSQDLILTADVSVAEFLAVRRMIVLVHGLAKQFRISKADQLDNTESKIEV